MKRWPVLHPWLVLLPLCAGCVAPGDSKLRPEPQGKPVAYRPITPDMVNEDSARRLLAAEHEQIDRETR